MRIVTAGKWAALFLGIFSSVCILILSTQENNLVTLKYKPSLWLGALVACVPLVLACMCIAMKSERSPRSPAFASPVESESEMNEYRFQYYENLRQRLTSQGDRLWNRFNYFLTIETALVGAFFIRPDHLGEGNRLFGLGILGLIWSIAWFLIAAQDLWFYEDRYERLKVFEEQIIKSQISFTYTASWEASMPRWKKFLCFKIPKCGSTTFSVICPVVFVLLWIALLLFTPFKGNASGL